MTEIKKQRILNHLHKLKLYGYNYISPIVLHSNNDILPNDILQLELMISNCNLCTKANSAKQVLVSQGNKKSDIVFLIPNVNSLTNDLNSNFAGKSGDILSNIIKNVFEKENDNIYITNIIKCFMSNNEIGEQEIDCCKPYLEKQIQLVDPKVIVGFGIECYNYLYNQKIEFSKIDSQILDYKGKKLIVTHSLEMLLRNPTLKKDVLNSVLKAKDILEKN